MTPDTERVPAPRVIEAPGTPPFQHMPFRAFCYSPLARRPALQGNRRASRISSAPMAAV